MKNVLILICLITSLISCGKAPENLLPAGEKAKSDDKKSDEKDAKKKTKNVCRADVTFLDVKSIRYEVKKNDDGSTMVKCLVTDNANLDTETVVHYGTGDSGEKYSSICKVYYKNSKWLSFVQNGNYTPNIPMKLPIETGFYITGTGTAPADEDMFSKTTCTEQEV